MRLVGNFGLKSGPEIEQEFEDALRFFDKDGRGVIESDQLKAALQTCGEPLEDDDIVELLKAADMKGDGKIDYLGQMFQLLLRYNHACMHFLLFNSAWLEQYSEYNIHHFRCLQVTTADSWRFFS